MTVRQIYILNTILRFHKTSLITCPIVKRPRRYDIWKTRVTRTKFGKRYSRFVAPYLYTNVNKMLNIKKIKQIQMQTNHF